MPRLIRLNPFATYGVVALFLFLVIKAFDLQYDDGGVGTALIISSPIWGVIYWAPQEILYELSDGKAFPGQSAISFSVGMLVCLIADSVLKRTGKRNENNNQGNTA